MSEDSGEIPERFRRLTDATLWLATFRLHIAMGARGFDDQWLSQRTGIPEERIRLWLRTKDGTARISETDLVLLSEELDYPPHFFQGGEEPQAWEADEAMLKTMHIAFNEERVCDRCEVASEPASSFEVASWCIALGWWLNVPPRFWGSWYVPMGDADTVDLCPKCAKKTLREAKEPPLKNFPRR